MYLFRSRRQRSETTRWTGFRGLQKLKRCPGQGVALVGLASFAVCHQSLVHELDLTDVQKAVIVELKIEHGVGPS
jgi:hypothetical protein